MTSVPEINVEQLSQRLAESPTVTLLDVREPAELAQANLGEEVLLAPLSQLAELGLDALPCQLIDDKDAAIVVFCHHGIRSAQVVSWLRRTGWSGALNLRGGIDVYARRIDPSIGVY